MTGSLGWVAAEDGSRRRVIETEVGAVETGFYPMADADTVCVSVQAGCNIGCRFCLTGTSRSTGNLTVPDIVGQVEAVQQFRRPRTRMGVAFQGMGEPLLNYRSVVRSVAVLLESGLGDTFRVSTIGLPRRIDELGRDLPFVKLQISLHSAIESQRRDLVPGSAGSPLPEVIAAGARHAALTDLPTVLNYVLLRGVNDSAEHVAAIERLLRGLNDRFRLKVSSYNPHPRLPFTPASDEARSAFVADLAAEGVDAFTFDSMGTEIGSGCGHFNPGARAAPSTAGVNGDG